MNSVLFPTASQITTEQRLHALGQKACVIWFTGLSGAGKTTLASMLELKLYVMGYKTYMLDGDIVRKGLNKDLSFSLESRKENMRRVGEVAKLMADAGLIVIAAFISPFRSDREKIKKNIGEERFVEIFVDCPLEVCKKRDAKGLYKKAKRGEIKNFTGIDSPYEKPESPDIVIQTHVEEIEDAMKKILTRIESKIKL